MKKEYGYTLTELVIVIVLLLVIAVIITPKIAGYSQSVIYQDIKTIKHYIVYAQELAMTRNDNYGVCFDTNAGTFSVNKIDCSSANTVNSPESRGDKLAISLNSSVSISPSGTTSIFFDKKGAPTPDGATITLTYGSISKTLVIEAKTGFVYEQ